MNNPLFGITLSLVAYLLVAEVQKRTKIELLNPLLFGGILVIAFLLVFNIDLADYQVGGDMIKALIGPATISLAIPLYKNLDLIKKNVKLLIVAITTAIISHFIILMIIILLLNLEKDLALSLIPKSITTPLATDVSGAIGGISEITIMVVLLTGIFGAAISPLINKLFKINDDTAIGLALGTSSHAVGTAKAASTSETQGSYSSIALILTGIFTVILAPVMAYILALFI